ncbi:hypothetical protein PT2222_230076 [Paraburkholderia tropica]
MSEARVPIRNITGVGFARAVLHRYGSGAPPGCARRDAAAPMKNAPRRARGARRGAFSTCCAFCALSARPACVSA